MLAFVANVAVAALPEQLVELPLIFIVWPLNIVATVATDKAAGVAAALALLLPKIVYAVIFSIFANVTLPFAMVTFVAVVAVAAFPVMFMPHVPLAPVPVFVTV